MKWPRKKWMLMKLEKKAKELDRSSDLISRYLMIVNHLDEQDDKIIEKMNKAYYQIERIEKDM